MAELADALDSGSSGRKAVQVQILFPAEIQQKYKVGKANFTGAGKIGLPAAFEGRLISWAVEDSNL